MRAKVVSLILLCVLVVMGCTTRAEQEVISSDVAVAGACPAPELGIVAAEDLRVLAVVRNSPAAAAGVQVGDMLIDLTWIKMEWRINCNDVIVMDGSGSPLPTVAARLPANVEEPAHPTEPVPFTNRQAVRDLAGYGATMRLRVQRDGQQLELTITPDIFLHNPHIPNAPTATPITVDHTYF